ncbi:hypothetical protein G6O69_13050 [Pseudenhygromyxa sp. WMMC2535]|uniref:hypothetical protein n=1 Tax=Pseudenhygromyxa sp. WMMC2535 TaxID=2712867 RepID=UPI001595543D|nr:hypothetical protein [Pseudenhygromyxa sp. WMMC2535]NVB38761.1 hypothetical protein [Pseudenhygromyxa sp. WMMC2535]
MASGRAAGWQAMQWVLRFALAAGVFVGSVDSARAAEPETARDEIIDVEIDVADLPESWAGIEVDAETEIQRMLAEESELPPGVILADDRQVLVEIRPSPMPGTDDLLVHVEVRLEGETVGESVTDSCLSCTTAGVAELVMRLLLPLLPGLPEPVEEEPLGPAPDMVDAPAPEPVGKRPVSPLLIAGATLLGGGLISVGVGAGLMAVDERVVSPPGAGHLEVIKYREVGVATAVIGGAAALGGAVMLGVALGQRRDLRVAAAPTLGPGLWGLSLSGRF